MPPTTLGFPWLLRPGFSIPTSRATLNCARRLQQAVESVALRSSRRRPCECIQHQQHDARVVGFARHQLRQQGRGNLVKHPSGRRPLSRGRAGERITKDRATRVPRPVTVSVIAVRRQVTSFAVRLAVQAYPPGLGGHCTLRKDYLGGPV